MTKMTRESYVSQGRETAQRGGPMTTLRPGTWQHRAWMDGYNSVSLVQPQPRGPNKSVLAAAGVPIADLAAAIRHRDKWPPSAREHAHALINDMGTEQDPKRMRRLVLAVQRLAMRHDPKLPSALGSQATSVWVDELNASQIHQDGPQGPKGTDNE